MHVLVSLLALSLLHKLRSLVVLFSWLFYYPVAAAFGSLKGCKSKLWIAADLMTSWLICQF